MAIKTYYVSKLGRDYQISPHFKLREFQSKDGADKVLISDELLAKLEELRAYGGFVITINSGYRSAAHNKKVGGASNSSHTRGLAADVKVKKDGSYVSAKLICALCQTLGFDGVAYINANSVHLDMANRTYRGDERNGYGNNVGGDFYKYFGITKAQIEALRARQDTEKPPKKEEAMEITKEEIKAIVAETIAELMTKKAQETPGEWSEEARKWAVDSELIKGTGVSYDWKGTVDREQLVTIIYRLAKKIDPVK